MLEFRSLFVKFSGLWDGYENISISYDQVGALTAPRDYYFEYSTNGGFFAPFGSTYQVLTNGISLNNEGSGLSTTAWNTNTVQGAYNLSFNLGSIASVNNQTTLYFRVVVADKTNEIGNALIVSGQDRIDNFTVTGDLQSVPEPATVGLLTLGGLACLFAGRRKK